MYFRENKGVTLMALAITIIVMLIISGTIIFNMNRHINMEKVYKLYEDIEKLNAKVEDFYLKYGELPIIEELYCKKSELEEIINANKGTASLNTMDGLITNPNDGDEYYVIDLEKLEGLTLTYGCGEDYNNAKSIVNDEDDSTNLTTNFDEIYIINKSSHQIYYPSGVLVNESMYYLYNSVEKGVINDKSASYDNGIAEFENKNIMQIKNFKIHGNTVQNGTPEPDNEIEVKSVGNATRNLCSLGTVTFVKYKEYILSEYIEPGTYTFSCLVNSTDVDDSTSLVIIIDESNGQVPVYGVTRNQRVARQFTAKKRFNKIRLYAAETWVDGDGDTVTFEDIQIEKGSRATEYVPYGEFSYKIPVRITGKNLFDITKSENGTITSYPGTDSDVSNRCRTPYIYLKSGNYVCSFKNTNLQTGSIHIYSCANTSGWISTLSSSRTVKDGLGITKFTLSQDYYVRFAFNPKDETVITNLDTEMLKECEVMLERGDTPSEYEPYLETEIININLDEPLRKIGNYSDYIDFIDKKIVRNCARYDFTGEENWYENETNDSIAMANITTIGLKTDYKELSNRFNVIDSVNEISMGLSNNKSNLIQINKYKTIPEVTDIASLQTWLKNKPTHFIYVRETPIEEKLDLPENVLIEGFNTITVMTDTNPSNIELPYYQINK